MAADLQQYSVSDRPTFFKHFQPGNVHQRDMDNAATNMLSEFFHWRIT